MTNNTFSQYYNDVPDGATSALSEHRHASGAKTWLRKSIRAAILGGACGIVALLTPFTASAATCDGTNTYDFASGDYFASLGVCAVNAAENAGTSALTNVGKSLAATAINSYLPGIGTALFGGGDPFADDMKRIIEEVIKSKEAIIDEIVKMHERNIQIDLKTQMDGMVVLALNYQTLVRKSAPGSMPADLYLNSYFDTYFVLDDLRNDLQTPMPTSSSPGTELTADDLKALHMAVTVAGLQFKLAPIWARADATNQAVSEKGPYAAELARGIVRTMLDTRLDGAAMGTGLMEYLTILDKPVDASGSRKVDSSGVPVRNLFWQASAGKVTPLTLKANGVYEWSIGSLVHWVSVGFLDNNANRFYIMHSVGPCQTCSPVTVLERELIASQSDYNKVGQYAETWRQASMTNAYNNFLLQVYGAVRPAIDSWYRDIGEVPPRLDIDNDLESILGQAQASDTTRNENAPPLSSFSSDGWTQWDERLRYERAHVV